MLTHFPLEGGHGISLSPSNPFYSFLTLKLSLILVSHQPFLDTYFLIKEKCIFCSLIIIKELL